MEGVLTLEGKTALITGASRGIGLAMADRFLQAGANVMLSVADGRRPGPRHGRPGGRGGRRRRVAWQAAHVGDAEQAQACVGETIARFGGLDILVNNAATNPYFGPMIDIDVPRAQKTFEVNQLAVLLWTSYAVKAGLAGSVINVASIGGLEVEPGIGWYNVTKAAVLHITKQLAYELAPKIRVNALAPGPDQDRFRPGTVGGSGRRARDGPHPAGPPGLTRRRRDGGAVPGLRCRIVGHRADAGGGRGHDSAPFRRRELKENPSGDKEPLRRDSPQLR